MMLSLAPGRGPRLGSWIGDTIAKLDNLGTAVCPTVATAVGSAYGMPVGAVSGALPSLCELSRQVDPTHWVSVGLEHLFGTSSSSSPSSGPSPADLQAQAQIAAEHTRNMLLVFAGLAGAGAVGFFLLRGHADAS